MNHRFRTWRPSWDSRRRGRFFSVLWTTLVSKSMTRMSFAHLSSKTMSQRVLKQLAVPTLLLHKEAQITKKTITEMMESALGKSYYHYLYNIFNHKTKYEVCNLPGIRCQALQIIHVGFFFIGFTNNEVGVSVNKQITGFMLKSFKTEGFYIWSIGIVHYVQIIIPTKRSILKGLEGCRLFLIKVQCRISILLSTFYSQETHLQASSAESSQQYRQIFYSSNIFQRTQKTNQPDRWKIFQKTQQTIVIGQQLCSHWCVWQANVESLTIIWNALPGDKKASHAHVQKDTAWNFIRQ